MQGSWDSIISLAIKLLTSDYVKKKQTTRSNGHICISDSSEMSETGPDTVESRRTKQQIVNSRCTLAALCLFKLHHDILFSFFTLPFFDKNKPNVLFWAIMYYASPHTFAYLIGAYRLCYLGSLGKRTALGLAWFSSSDLAHDVTSVLGMGSYSVTQGDDSGLVA